jgi:P pilus assembly chaperone PapD
LLFLAVALLGPAYAWAGAVLFIYPTLIMFDGNKRSATITLTNRGDAIGTFETSWTEHEMTPEGGLVKVEGEVPWSVQPYVRYSPRRVTLEPSESQVIKVALRRDQEAPKGEFYSHFKVVTLNSQDLQDEANEETEPQSDSAVTIRARSAVAIPIIWRNSPDEQGANIESVVFDRETNQLKIDVRRLGNLSVRGFIHVLGETPDGTSGPLADAVQLVIYPSVEKRSMAITLNEDVTAEALARNAEVIYSSDPDVISDDTTLASYPIVP